MSGKEGKMIFQLQLRNEKGLVYVMEKYKSMVWSLIIKHLFILPDLQTECFKEVFVQVWENINCFDEEKNEFPVWLAAVARYNCIHFFSNYLKESEERHQNSNNDKMLQWLIQKELSEEAEVMTIGLTPEEQELFWTFHGDAYELLNGIETDFYEYEKKNIVKHVEEQTMQEVMQEISHRKTIGDIFTKIFGRFLTSNINNLPVA